MDEKKTDDEEKKEPQEQAEKASSEDISLKEVVREQAREDENPNASTFTFKRVLGGDFLTAVMLRKYIGLTILITAFAIVYVANRYSCQKDMLEIDRLEKELQDAKYRALSSSSQLTEMCRESNVIKMLQHSSDSMLQVSQQPPYIIKVPKK